MNKKDVKTMIKFGSMAVFMASVAGCSYYLTEKLVSVAIDRKMPKALEKTRESIAGSEKLRHIFDMQKSAAEKLENSEYETYEIAAYDGETLVGHFKRVENPKRTIIAFHGWRSSWSMDFGLIADFWLNNNCNVLFVEQRGQNGSSGSYMGFGLLERYDCLSWANWLSERNEGLPVYLAGVSMGASTVLMASELNLPDCVHGIMADCGYTSPYAIWKYIMEKNLHLPYTGLRARIVDDMCRRKLNNRNSRHSCCDALQNCTVPVIFAHGADDHFVPVEMTYQNYLACKSPKRLLIVPGADHGMSYLIEREKYEKECLSFWNDYDGDSSKNKDNEEKKCE